jgi:hypothetical protein
MMILERGLPVEPAITQASPKTPIEEAVYFAGQM